MEGWWGVVVGDKMLACLLYRQAHQRRLSETKAFEGVQRS